MPASISSNASSTTSVRARPNAAPPRLTSSTTRARAARRFSGAIKPGPRGGEWQLLECVAAGLSCTDTPRRLHGYDPDLAIADLARSGGLDEPLGHPVDVAVIDQHFYPHPVSYTHLRAHETDSYLV